MPIYEVECVEHAKNGEETEEIRVSIYIFAQDIPDAAATVVPFIGGDAVVGINLMGEHSILSNKTIEAVKNEEIITLSALTGEDEVKKTE